MDVNQMDFLAQKLRLLTGFNGGMMPGVLNPGYMVGGPQPPMINMGGGYLQPQYPQVSILATGLNKDTC